MGIRQEGIMATETYSISPAGQWVEESSCSCHSRTMMISKKRSLTSSSSSISTSTGKRCRTWTYSPMLITLIVWLSYLTCCVSAWPAMNGNTRRSLNYAPVVLPPDYDLGMSQWVMAEQPRDRDNVQDNYFPDDELTNLNQQQQEIYDYPLYEDLEDDTYQNQMQNMPYFGPIIPEEAEEEQELEELKHEQPFRYEKRRSGKVMNTKKPIVTSTTTPTPIAKPSSPSSSASTMVASSPLKKAEVRKPGQKEIAMLRPPSSKSSHHLQGGVEQEEPKISVAQRSPSNEKPSAYDRLRKYLSLDDALKKEYQQRRANAVNRHSKRESISSIVTDSDSLTGQLNGLKKKMD